MSCHMMLTVTEEAGAYLTRLLSFERRGERVFRLRVDGEDLRLVLDDLRSGDAAFAYEGKIVLVVGVNLARALNSRRLDVQPTEFGPLLAVE